MRPATSTGATAAGGPGLYAMLMARAAGLPNDDLFARMLLAQAAGQGALPPGLGLDGDTFKAMMVRHFPGFRLPGTLARGSRDGDRRAEWDDLHDLLLAHRAGSDASEAWMAAIVASACMGDDHLWQDLGLWSRVDLSRLMNANFPSLAASNTRDMKWKKFLYKQLCESEGMHVCRAPSCEACVDYPVCFGPEV